MEKASAASGGGAGPTPKSTTFGMYYSNTASSLSKRPLGEIYTDAGMKKKGERNPLNPKTKKSFGAVTSKLDTGIKNKGAQATGTRVSDGVTAKRKDELYGR